MSFKNDNPDWKVCMEDAWNMKSIPHEVWPELCGLIRKASTNEHVLKAILNSIAEILPCETTASWSWSWLEREISEYVSNIRAKVANGRFDKFMDCLMVLVEVGDLSIDDINDFLEEHKIGYYCEKDAFKGTYHWISRDKSLLVDEMNETQAVIESVSHQAYEEFERAKVSLESATEERARKDAVRSCLSALEAVIKEYGKNQDIKKASKNLRDSGKWGLDDIVKEGDALFSNMHRLYPDLRHGSTELGSMSMEEAEYWIGRFSNYMRYMKKMAERNGM